MKKINPTPIDLTEDKLFTLTSESKEKIKDIDKDINIYFVGYSDDDSTLDLAKQYTKVNDKIKVEAVTQDSRPDLVQKYGIETSSNGIIVECGDNYKVLASSDLYTYDKSTGESVNVAEEKLTAAIRTVSVEELPKVKGRKDKRNIKNTRYYILNKAKECFEHAAQLGHSLAGSKARQVEGEMSRL